MKDNVLGTALASFQGFLPALMNPGTAFAASVLSFCSVMVGADNLRMLGIVTLAMLADIIIGGLWAMIDPRQDFDAKRLFAGILSKVFRLMLVPVASIGDWMIMSSPFGNTIDIAHYSYPVVAFALWALAVAEFISSLNKFKQAGVLPSEIDSIIRRFRSTGQEIK